MEPGPQESLAGPQEVREGKGHRGWVRVEWLKEPEGPDQQLTKEVTLIRQLFTEHKPHAKHSLRTGDRVVIETDPPTLAVW